MKRKFSGLLRLFRPELPFAAGVCVIVGEIIAFGGFPSFRELSLGFLCGFFLSGAALILNDLFDLEVDKVNAPERPLPSGAVSKADVIALTAFATLVGLVAAYIISLPALIVSIIFWWIGFLYNWKFKQSGLIGNLMVAASVAVTFVIGGMAAGDPWNPLVWFFVLIAFLIDFGEEIAGDVMDIEGDKLRGSRSIAIVMGRQTALRLSASVFFLVVLLGFVPVILGWLDAGYLFLLVIAGGVVAYHAVRLVKSKTPEEGRMLMRRIYLTPVLGLLMFIVVSFFS